MCLPLPAWAAPPEQSVELDAPASPMEDDVELEEPAMAEESVEVELEDPSREATAVELSDEPFCTALVNKRTMMVMGYVLTDPLLDKMVLVESCAGLGSAVTADAQKKMAAAKYLGNMMNDAVRW